MNRIDQISGIVQAVKKHIEEKPTLNMDGYVINQIVVTGRFYMSKVRFKQNYEATAVGYATAMEHINLWNGSVWGIDAETGKRHLLKRVKD